MEQTSKSATASYSGIRLGFGNAVFRTEHSRLNTSKIFILIGIVLQISACKSIVVRLPVSAQND